MKIDLVLMDGEELAVDVPAPVPDAFELVVYGCRRAFQRERDGRFGEVLTADDLLLLDEPDDARDRRLMGSGDYARRKAAAEGVPFLSEDDL